MSEKTGLIDFAYGSETFQTYYKVIGDLSSSRTPLVVLHGGPGIPHSYMSPHGSLWASHGIPAIFYDQVGVGKATHLPHKPSSFWTVELFMDELDNVLAHFGIAENFMLLGHSWGGMLAADYVATRRPKGLKRLVLVSAPASMQLWDVGIERLLAWFPEDFVKMLKKHEEEGTTDAKEYQDGVMEFYKVHVCRTDPWPADLVAAFGAMEEDSTVYKTMAGPSEFNITGSLKTWSVVDKIHHINYPTLLINGAEDEAQDLVMAPFFEGLAKVKWVRFAESSHMVFWEEKERYLTVLGDFLKA
ncbi:proline-specific peptidase [Stereum hirsutum FP-91666 SS1]|uniref:proline-specific peptidase n=1 Tax=Stereum hirsutum (strain FP-91666) TaxID=721885 RepID=UPI000440BBE0|nr:proline-specific peptidase [Stereum hirsutum FP-91666 SS1]EIM89385.1 proline-specific peptidase [Stereum hirsutum FP-91666 SS1]